MEMENDKVIDIETDDVLNNPPTDIKDEDLIKEINKAASNVNQFTTEIKDVIREYFKQQFTSGLTVGTKTMATVVYRMVGLGEKNYGEMEKEELVELLNTIKGFCERSLKDDLNKIKEELKGDDPL